MVEALEARAVNAIYDKFKPILLQLAEINGLANAEKAKADGS